LLNTLSGDWFIWIFVSNLNYNAMKKIIYYFALLLSFNLLAQTPTQYNTITDLTFTDVDGQTHNLYNLIDEGYRVILDFGFIGCGPCSQWSEYVGPEIWDEYGPDGDNSLRMFYFEVGSNFEDYEVENYYSGLGVEYPIINANFDSIESQYQAYFDANILDGGYPIHVFVCQDTTYRLDFGYSYTHSHSAAEHILKNSCNGQDLHHKDVAMKGLNNSFSYCSQNNGPISFRPMLNIYHNGGIQYEIDPPNPPAQSEYSINDTFLVKTYINNTYFRTDTLDPNDWGDSVDFDEANNDDDIGQGQEWSFSIPPIEIEVNDSVKFELLYPEDSYLPNNTYSFKVEQEQETKTASSNLLRLAFGNPQMYASLFNQDEVGVEFAGQGIVIQQGYDTLLTINNGQCYAISIINAHLADAYLIQSNNNDTIFHHKLDGTTFESQFYYFNIDSTATSVAEQHILPKRLSYVLYYDMLGKLQKEKVFSRLPKGVYLRVNYYTDGTFTSEKVAKVIIQ
jgi:hypothetical protein